MPKQHSPSRASASRPSNPHKPRSNSFPLVHVLGISTSEAELILAEGRAAVQSRFASRMRRERRNRSESEHLFRGTGFRPQDHIRFLAPHQASEETLIDEPISHDPEHTQHHARIPSVTSDRSTSTITGPVAPSVQLSPTTPVGHYSANLAKFIKMQLNSITSYHAIANPRSCPDLHLQSNTPLVSPTNIAKRVEPPSLIEIPPVRPPLRSAFSAWSSTDDELDDETDDDLAPLPSTLPTPWEETEAIDSSSILHYYENSNNTSFLFSSPPVDSERTEHPNATSFSFPQQPHSPAKKPESPAPQWDFGFDSPSSSLSSRPMLSSSSAPSSSAPSSILTASYFDCKRALPIAPHIRDRIIAAVSPHGVNPRVLKATSPFEGGALAGVHNVYFYEAQHRVRVDGLSFDLMNNNFNIPGVAPRVPTPC